MMQCVIPEFRASEISGTQGRARHSALSMSKGAREVASVVAWFDKLTTRVKVRASVRFYRDDKAIDVSS